MKQSLFTVFSNRLLTPDARQPVCEMVLEGDLTPAPGAVNRPGQFVNVRLDGLFLRRPISVCDMDEAAGRLTLVYKVVGEGTAQMRDMVPGQTLRAVFRSVKTGGQFSFEERMGCGFGACMGCSCKTVTGWKRICREGPVLEKEEILWEK